MDEGVDPKDMCQSLMDRVAQSEQLRAVTDPEILILFENWLEELENEVIALVKKTGSLDPNNLAEETGLSRSGAKFLITKLRRAEKL